MKVFAEISILLLQTQILDASVFMEKIFSNPKFLFWYYILVNLVPSIFFFLFAPYNLAGRIAVLLFPFSLYLFYFSLFKNSNKAEIFLLPLTFLHSFQIVLFYLFGNNISPISVNMFISTMTTDSGEASEVLGSLIPVVGLVLIIYLPALIIAIRQWIKKTSLSRTYRKKTILSGIILLLISVVLLPISKDTQDQSFAVSTKIFPVNVINNLKLSLQKINQINNYPKTSEGFTFEAQRDSVSEQREIYVLHIGETARMANWQLFGYERATTPQLKKRDDILLFEDALTQANVTYQSVPTILSDVDIRKYSKIYEHKSIFTAFKEAGFKTLFLSNQTDRSTSLIEQFSYEADEYFSLKENTKSGDFEDHYDEKLLPLLEKAITENEEDLFIVLHSHGSHFKYTDRYPEKFEKFKAGNIGSMTPSERETILNAYDNSILYADYFIDKTLDILNNTAAKTALLYSSDHGEDIFDDERENSLHSSTFPSYYQLHIPFFIWLSEDYKSDYSSQYENVKNNLNKPVSTGAVFHTLLDLAQIKSPYLDDQRALSSSKFDMNKRFFLTDDDNSTLYQNIIFASQDSVQLKKNKIYPFYKK